jgi:hypothetical protein
MALADVRGDTDAGAPQLRAEHEALVAGSIRVIR